MAENLYAEVRDYIQDQLDAGVIIRADWVTAGILSDKAEPECDDADFYLLCARAHLAEIVKKCIGKYKAAPVRDDQLTLPGFEHLQRGYQVERDGIRLLVPTDLLTDEEIEGRAAEYDAMAAGCRAHARELRDFVERRRSVSGAA